MLFITRAVLTHAFQISLICCAASRGAHGLGGRFLDRDTLTCTTLDEPTFEAHEETAAYFESLFSTIHGDVVWDLQEEEEELFRMHKSPPLYGYVTHQGTKMMLSRVNTTDKVFIDLGSGEGRVVIGAALEYPKLRHSVGIELSPSRHNQAKGIRSKLSEQLQEKVDLREANILHEDLTQVDIVWLSNLGFSKELNIEIGEKLRKELKSGAHVFSSKSIDLGEKATEQGEVTVAMSWNPDSRVRWYSLA